MVHLPSLAKHLSLIHLLLWALFIGVFIVRRVQSLMLEPYVTPYVLMGACSGYLLIGYAGSFLLHSLMIWHPAAVDPASLPADIDPIAHPLKVFPAMVCASFEALTILGNGVSRAGQLGGRVCCLTIAILGQLDVAMLIGLILGAPSRGSGPEAWDALRQLQGDRPQERTAEVVQQPRRHPRRGQGLQGRQKPHEGQRHRLGVVGRLADVVAEGQGQDWSKQARNWGKPSS
jgi:hypothetical protein